MAQLAIQVTLTSVWTLFAGPIAESITPEGWYGLGAGLAGALLLVALVLLPETKYDRPLTSYQETDSDPTSTSSDLKKDLGAEVCTIRPALDYERYAPRTWKSDMRLWVGKPQWTETWDVLRVSPYLCRQNHLYIISNPSQQTFELLFFPNVLWALLLNGLTIGVNVAIGTTYSTILADPPYNWPDSSASYINCGQIIVAIVALPLLGHGSDYLVKYFANRNNGIHEPEIRIIPLIFPIIVGTFTAALYGQGGAHPYEYHWFIYAWTVAAYYFCFVGANIVGITYLLDSYPGRSGPLLVIICAFRGFISFGTSYAVSPFIALHGYDGAFGTYAALTAAFGLLGIPVFIWGKQIRRFTGRFAKNKTD